MSGLKSHDLTKLLYREGCGSQPEKPQSKIPELTANLHTLTLSGHTGYLLYKKACEYQWTMTGEHDESLASQHMFHCRFGTHKEDFGVLSQITSCARCFN